jgi:hypothetical protein
LHANPSDDSGRVEDILEKEMMMDLISHKGPTLRLDGFSIKVFPMGFKGRRIFHGFQIFRIKKV